MYSNQTVQVTPYSPTTPNSPQDTEPLNGGKNTSAAYQRVYSEKSDSHQSNRNTSKNVNSRHDKQVSFKLTVHEEKKEQLSSVSNILDGICFLCCYPFYIQTIY